MQTLDLPLSLPPRDSIEILNTLAMERVTMLAMLTLSALSVLLLQHGAQGTRIVSSRVQSKLSSCNFPGATRGWDCFNPPKLEDLPPCKFKHHRVGVDCWLTSSPAVKVWTSVTKIPGLHCLKCLAIIYHYGICLGDIFVGSTSTQNMSDVHFKFLQLRDQRPLKFYDVAILAEHETPLKTKTVRLWKINSGYPDDVHRPVSNWIENFSLGVKYLEICNIMIT